MNPALKENRKLDYQTECCRLTELKARVSELEQENSREYQRGRDDETAAVMQHTSCFSCGVAWSPQNKDEKCPEAHRESWGHEWVSRRLKELTNRVVRLTAILERVVNDPGSVSLMEIDKLLKGVE